MLKGLKKRTFIEKYQIEVMNQNVNNGKNIRDSSIRNIG